MATRAKGHRLAKAVPASGIPHGEAKQYAPPGGKVWRKLAERAGCGVLPPYGEVTRQWFKYTEQGALREVLQALWSLWLSRHGFLTSQCPVKGIF